MNERTIKRLRFIIDVAFFATIALLAFLALKYVTGWVLPFIVAFVIVSILHPIIRRIKKWLHIERPIISLLILLLIYALFVTLIGFLGVKLTVIIRDLLAQLPDFYYSTILPTINSVYDALTRYLRDLPPEWHEQLGNLQDQLINALQSLLLNISATGVNWLKNITGSLPTFLITLVFTIMLSFFISMQYSSVTDFFKNLMPPRYLELYGEFRKAVRDTALRYLRATFTLMLITAVELAVGLMILRVNGAVFVAVGIAIFDALPFFGTGAIMIPWVIIELLQGNFSRALWLIVLYGIVTVVRNIIEPKIVSDKLGLNPIISLVAIYLGFRTMGVLGMIFMPILVQIIFAMHASGSFTLFEQRGNPGVQTSSPDRKDPEYMKNPLPNIYELHIPLPDSPLRAINCYIVKTPGGRGLIVDTGFNNKEGEALILSALKELEMTLDETDIFITHLHVDHCGLVYKLKTKNNKVYSSAVDGEIITNFSTSSYWSRISDYSAWSGIPDGEALWPEEHVSHINRPEAPVNLTCLAPGDTLLVGGYLFEVMDLAGHTPGQIGLYCADESILFCGDHILGSISPNIAAWDMDNDYLAIFLANVARIRDLNLKYIFAAHRDNPENPSARATELIAHHGERLDEIRSLMADGKDRTAYEVASCITWSIKKGFQAFPKMQKWFACSEALAHLQYLYMHGEMTRVRDGESYRYRVVQPV